jgi:hypothetical protein
MNLPLALWTLLALLRFAPLEQQARGPWADPSPASAAERYLGIAQAVEAECRDARAPRDCAALLVALAVGESGLARDADVGPCHRVGGYKTRCDSGAAASVWQVQRWTAEVTVEDLFADRRLAARQALRVARASLRACRDLPAEDRLSALSGSCKAGPGPWRARWALYQTARTWEPGR